MDNVQDEVYYIACPESEGRNEDENFLEGLLEGLGDLLGSDDDDANDMGSALIDYMDRLHDTSRKTMDASMETGTALLIGPAGQVKCVGNNEYGQCGLDAIQNRRLGFGTTETMNGFPVTPLDGKIAVDVSMSTTFSVIVLEDGTIKTFGSVPNWVPSTESLTDVYSACASSNLVGVLGTNGVLQMHDANRRSIAQITGVSQYSCGHSHALALDESGVVWELSGTASSFVQLSDVPGQKPIRFVEAGWENSGVIDAEGAVFTWGMNDKGQLGHHFNDGAMLGSDINLAACTVEEDADICKVPLLPNTIAKYLSMGKSHSIVTMNNGHAVGFGLDAHAESTGVMVVPVFYNMWQTRLRRIMGSHYVKQPDLVATIEGDTISFETKIKCEPYFSEQ
jgi:hypothetical protein